MSDKSEKESTRERVIEKAIEIFSQKGYDTANLTDITEALGVTRSPIYYHFKDKYGLYKAAYLRWEDEFISAMETILGSEKDILSIFRDILDCCIWSYKRFAPNFFVGLESSPDLAELKQRYCVLVEDIFNREKAITIAAIDKGELCRNTDPDLVVGLLFAIYDGLRIGLERPVSGLKSSDITTLIEIQLSGISNYFCNPDDQTA